MSCFYEESVMQISEWFLNTLDDNSKSSGVFKDSVTCFLINTVH